MSRRTYAATCTDDAAYHGVMSANALTFDVDNRGVALRGPGASNKHVLSAIDSVTSYFVEGHRFAPSFVEKRWDGKEHLLVWKKRSEHFFVPIGLLEDAAAAAREAGADVSIDESRRTPAPVFKHAWNGEVVLRDYQRRALDAFIASGNGILKMVMGAGKTKTAARAIFELGTTALFVVTSKILMSQAHRVLSECLPGEDVGVVGNGEWNPGRGVTVAMLQTLVSRRKTKEYNALVGGVGLVIMDECHNARGQEFRRVLLDCDARHRMGLSATVFFDDDLEVERGVIWLKASCGPIREEVAASELIDAGWMMRPTFRLYRVRDPVDVVERFGYDLADECIVSNPARNGAVARIARGLVGDGLRVLVVSRRHTQVEAILDQCASVGLKATRVTGKETLAARERAITALVARDVHVLVGSVLGEGVDIPELEAVIVAEGGQDVKAALQRLRNMRPSPGKSECVVVDFMDLMHHRFAAHSRARLGAYRKEGAFRFEVLEIPS